MQLMKKIKQYNKRMFLVVKIFLEPFINIRKNKDFCKSMIYAYFYDLLKIKQDVILFESYHGSRIGDSPYAIYKKLIDIEEYKNFKFVWTVNDEDDYYLQEIKGISKNIIHVKRESFQYIRYLAQAKYLINNTTFPFYFQKKHGQVYINTWHGTPIKTLGKHVKGTMGQHKNAIRNFLQCDYIINPNKFTCDIINHAHDLQGLFNGYIVDEGYPRMDLTINADKNKAKELLAKVLNMDINKKIILYAPTWRGELGRINNNSNEIFNTIKYMHSEIPDGYILLLKVHGLTYKYIAKDENIKKLCIPDWVETNELLSVVDVLITDYSSIFFDFLPMKKPVIYFIYDKEKYQNERGLYINFENMPGPLCYNVEEVIFAIKEIDDDKHKYQHFYDDALKKYCYNDDGKATERIIDIIFKHNHTNNVYQIKDNKKIKILMYCGGFATNGVTISAINLLNNIDYSKHDVTVIFGGDVNEKTEVNLRRLNNNVKIIYRMGSFNFRVLEYWQHRFVISFGLNREWKKKLIPKKLYMKELHRLIGDTKYDVCIDFSGYTAFWALIFAYNNVIRKKVIYLHSDMVADSERKVERKLLFKQQFNIIFNLYKYYDKLICVSESSMESNISNLSFYCSEKSFALVNNCLNYKEILNSLDEHEYNNNINGYFIINEEYKNGILTMKYLKMPTEEEIVFVTVGRLSPEKDYAKLINAFSTVEIKYKNLRLYIIGEGPLKYKLCELIHNLGMENKIILTGQLNQPHPIVASCDCFIMSSNWEGQGIVLLEAMVLGKPIISTDIPGPRSVLADGYGHLVENSEEGLIAGMEKFINEGIKQKEFDYVKYNDKAIDLFYKEVCSIDEELSK